MIGVILVLLVDISFSFLILDGLGGGSTSYSIVMTGLGVIGCGGMIGLGGVACLGSCSIPHAASIASSFASSFAAKLSSIESTVLAIRVRSTGLLKGSMWSSDIGVLV